MNERIENPPLSIDDILNRAVDLTDSRTTYVNHIRFSIGVNEVTVDLYTVGPNPQDPSQLPLAQRVYRFAMPISAAKEMADLLLQGVARWEGTFGITLPYGLSGEDNAKAAKKRGE